jgi:apolipoprotein D and lipocalin family protein
MTEQTWHTLHSAAFAVAVAAAVTTSLGFTGLRSARAAGPDMAPSSEAQAGGPLAPLKPIANLDLPRYMGRWYELARYPNRFQQQCTGAATATYSLLPAGTVQVVNQCPLAGGKVDEAIGEARRVGPEGSPTLQVRFAPAWLSFLPMVWGDYWVVELDAAYQLAVVSEPRREYLWVLSRQPTLLAADWAALDQRLRLLGFEPARLIRSAVP